MSDTIILDRKLDMIISLLKIIAKNNIRVIEDEIFTTLNKKTIFQLCNGKYDMNDIAKRVGVSIEYVRLTLQEFENSGIVVIRKNGRKFIPERII